MAIINQNGTYMALPSAIKRGNPVALDTTSVWYSRAEMEEYAKNGPTAYVGQILSLVDAENENAVTAYIILDEAGSLTEVGSATLGDDKTITLDAEAGTLSLKNWGVEYYKWIDPVGEEGEEGYVAGHHEKHVMAEGEAWPAGLEPKAATAADGTVVLAWYQPSTTTIEGVSSAIASVQNTVTELASGIGSREDAAGAETVYGAINKVEEDNAANGEAIKELQEKQADYLPLAGGTLTGELVLADGHKAASENVVDTKIAAAIGSAGHLKREIVEALPAVSEADPDTIYMILKEGTTDYLEYILVGEGDAASLERIGDTEVDLTPYVKKVENAVANNLAALAADGALIDAGIALQDVVDHLADTNKHVTDEERHAWNEGATLAATNAEAIENLVKISQDDADKLAALPAITEIGANLELVDGVLSAVAEQYELPEASEEVLGGIKIGAGLAMEDGVASVVVNEGNGLTLGDNGIELALASDNAAGAMSKEMFVKLNNLPDNAQANVIEGALLGANEVVAEINDNKQLLLPFATADKPGVVMSSEADNAVAVNAATGVMSVNRVSTSKLYVPEGEELVLDGGSASN